MRTVIKAHALTIASIVFMFSPVYLLYTTPGLTNVIWWYAIPAAIFYVIFYRMHLQILK